MNETIDTIIKYLQNKNTTFTVAEVNEISSMLSKLKENNVDKKTEKKEAK